MKIEERFEKMKAGGNEVQRPMELFGLMDEDSTHHHLDWKQKTFANGALPAKYKALLALAAAVALDSSTCTVNNTKLAKKLGATKAEIMEAIAVAKFAKSATVLSNSAPALEWLLTQEKEA
ncbi:MAG: carboxymuconolactone decarboxylase family protein [Rectinema subterraneum]|uniref:carboxymuconolactone decarboxylase family protein n=1 Tax=Rectinema subterraneum TaxID=2653714 RepID=UPI003C7ACF9C